jgi:hypothetical protein
MESGADQIFVLVNRSDSSQNVGAIPSGTYTNLLTGSSVNGPSVSIPARSSFILVAQ